MLSPLGSGPPGPHVRIFARAKQPFQVFRELFAVGGFFIRRNDHAQRHRTQRDNLEIVELLLREIFDCLGELGIVLDVLARFQQGVDTDRGGEIRRQTVVELVMDFLPVAAFVLPAP